MYFNVFDEFVGLFAYTAAALSAERVYNSVLFRRDKSRFGWILSREGKSGAIAQDKP